MQRTLAAVALLAVTALSHAAEPTAAKPGTVGPGVPAFDVRPGYKVTLAAENFGQARFMEIDDKGTLYVSQPQTGSVMALKDTDGDGVYETKTKFLSGYPDAHSMVWHDGALYVTSSADGSCKRCRDTKGDGTADQVDYFLKPGSVPAGGGHPFRGIVFTKDACYVSVSDPQNMTDDVNSDRKSVYKFDLQGNNRTRFASGIRNTEKLRLRPGTEEIWGLDHGSDNFGERYGDNRRSQPITDVLPGEELNRFTEGAFYGHPYLSNNRIVRPEYADRKDLHELAEKTVPPEWTFGAHWAGNGFTFLSQDKLTGQAGDLIATFHGSWNSKQKVGYRVDRVLFDAVTGKPYGDLRLVSTLNADGTNSLARPVDAVETADGTVLFSCDQTNKIYRISKADTQ